MWIDPGTLIAEVVTVDAFVQRSALRAGSASMRFNTIVHMLSAFSEGDSEMVQFEAKVVQ